MVSISSSAKFATCVVKGVMAKRKNSMHWVSPTHCDVNDCLRP